MNTEKETEEGRKALEEHKAREERFRLEKGKKTKKKKIVMAIAIVMSVIIISLVTKAVISPGKYDGFAKCLTEKGAVMYGEDWCKYTDAQKTMFGKSFKYINYHVKTDLDVRPTWLINGKTYGTVQSFERLAALTGCEY